MLDIANKTQNLHCMSPLGCFSFSFITIPNYKVYSLSKALQTTSISLPLMLINEVSGAALRERAGFCLPLPGWALYIFFGLKEEDLFEVVAFI